MPNVDKSAEEHWDEDYYEAEAVGKNQINQLPHSIIKRVLEVKQHTDTQLHVNFHKICDAVIPEGQFYDLFDFGFEPGWFQK